MSESITNFGTPRSIYSLANGDIEIFGNVIANQFIGDGQNLTNISIEQINASTINYNKKLLRELGGTNNNNYIDKGILFNNDTTQKFETSPNLYWDYDNNILYVNNQNIIKTFSNYVESYSNATSKEIIDTSNNIINEIKKHILSNISIENIKDLPKGSEQQYGILKVGEGIFVDNGVISIVPKPISITKPTVEPELPPYIFPDTIYEKYVFKYDPKKKTTFDDEDILQYFFNFDKITNVSNIKSIRKQLNNIIINSQIDVLLKKLVDYKYEYTPLENNYLYFSGTSSSYASFDEDFDLYNIYSTNLSVGGTEIGFTFSFWFKIYDLISSEKFLFSFSNSNSNTYRFEIKLISETDVDNNNFNYLVVNIRQLSDYQYIIRNISINPNDWYHFVWTINANNTWTLYLNNQKNILIDDFIEQIVPDINIGIFSDSKYIAKTIGNALFRTNVNLEFSITDLRIYNKALTKSEIFELYIANEYTLYKLKFNDPNYTTCDILLIGGGGGGTNEGGGGAGELIYIDNLTANQTDNDEYYEIKVGRGGAGRIIKDINGNSVIVQNNTAGINTVFDKLIVRGGGSYSISGGSGGSGSGNGGTSNLNVSADDYSFRKIYFRGNNGFELNGGGGGSGSSGYIYNGGRGLGAIIDDINDTVFNFKDIFDLLNDDDIGYYDSISKLSYFAAGGASNIDNAIGGIGGGGYGSDNYIENIRYEGLDNTGSGGGGYFNHGYSGGSGIVLLRYLKTQILSTDIGSKIISSSNNLLSIINNLNTDDIKQLDNSSNKFIINNVYDNNLLLNGTLTINSNLIVYGDTTILNTDIYISEKINISNYDNDTALYIRQFGDIIPINTDILRIDYNENTLLTVLNTGHIGIGVISPQSLNILDVHGNINIVSYLNEDFKFTINGRDIIKETSNFIISSENLLRSYYNIKFSETLEYIEDTCNIILDKINNLNADDIADGITNRFIINNRYDNSLELKGDIIASNLVIYGEKNIIYTDVYYSEQIEVDNKSYGNAISVIQSNTSYRIFNASNSTSEVFTILGDGSVGIGGVVPKGDNLLEVRGNINIVSYLNEDFKFTINGRDIIGETSNYIKSACNLLISYYDNEIIDAVIDLTSAISVSSDSMSNFVKSVSNILFIDYVTRDSLLSSDLTSVISLSAGFTSNFVRTTCNILFDDYVKRDNSTSNFVKIASNILFTDYVTRDTLLSTDLTSTILLSTRFTSNYVKTTSNILFTDYIARDTLLSSDLTSAINLSSGFTSNYIRSASNLLFADYIKRDTFTSNFVKSTSNLLNQLFIDYVTKDSFTCNYVKTTSNLLFTDYITRDSLISSELNAAILLSSGFTSNYVKSTSNLLFNNYILRDNFTSNYVKAASNILFSDYVTRDTLLSSDLKSAISLSSGYTSNYVKTASNILFSDYVTRDTLLSGDLKSAISLSSGYTSNYVKTASNILFTELSSINSSYSDYTSNFIKSTSNILFTNYIERNALLSSELLSKLSLSSEFTSNFIKITSNLLNSKVTDTNEYISDTSNLLSQRIGNLTADNISNGIINKFIINNTYEDDLEIIGRLTASNLIIYGEKTLLYTDIYTTEQLNIENQGTGTALIVKQINPNYSIFNASNSYSEVFTILNNGSVGIGGIIPSTDNLLEVRGNINIVSYLTDDYKFTINGRDIIADTCNYILSTSNAIENNYNSKISDSIEYIIRYILNTCNLIIEDYNSKFYNFKNYTLETSNYLNTDYDTKFSYISNYILDLSSSNIYNVDFDNRFESVSNYVLAISNYLNTDYDSKFAITEDYILATSNTIRSDYDSKLFDIASYIASISNYLNYQYFKMFTHRMIIQTAHKTYTKTVIKEDYTNGWVAIDNNENDGFVINIKPSHAASSILISMTCHIGIDYETESRWWGIQLYRKIGEGNWVSLENANGLDVEITDGSPCWISHNMGADSSLTSHSIINISGSFEDNPGTTSEVYYTAYWKSNLNNSYGRLYLNRPAYIDGINNSLNYPITSSSWTASEILNTNTPFLPETPTIIVTQDNVGIGTEPSLNNKLNVYGNINIVSNSNEDYKFTINGRDIIKDTSNYTLDTSNIISDRINNLTADDVQNGLINKYIVSGIYIGDIELKGDLITSNITIYGEKTKLLDDIFSTEAIEISNNGKYSTLNISQLDASYDIFNAYNNTGNVFTILGNGNVGIGTKNPVSILEVIGDVNINSNLYVNSNETIINSKLITNNILIENKTQENALTIKQLNGDKILAISNINVEVFTIKNNGKIGINNSSPENTLDVYGNINASSFTRNGFPLSLEFSQGMIIQTKHLTYSKSEIRNGYDWVPINNDISNGFVISIKPSDITSKILISTVCHIGMEYETDSRWWGLRLYRKIGTGEWTHLSNANGLIENNDNGTSCWISHNLGADSSTYSHFITNVTGSYQDIPETTEMVYYTAYWKNRVGESNNGLLYLNKSSYMLDNNYPCPSSSWTATEIWNKGVSYIAPEQSTQIQINTQYNSVGIDTSPPTEVFKLNVNGGINIIDGTYNINGIDIIQNTSNFILATSNILMQKINELLNRIELLENM